MRFVLGLSLILLGVLWLAATLDLRRPVESEATHWKDAPAGTQWRRTASGWQRAEQVVKSDARRPLRPTALSPLLVALWQLLVSVLALLVFPVATKKPTVTSSQLAVPSSALKRRSAKKTAGTVTS